MYIFWLLILAHFIADFPLQSDKIFALKSRYSWGVLPHIFISFITNLVIAFPYFGSNNFWIAMVFLAVVHFLLDWMKIVLIQKWLGDSLFTFLFDQVLHLLSIWICCYYLFTIPLPEIENSFILTYYLNKKIIIVLIGLVFSIFGGGVLIYYIRKMIHQIKTNEPGDLVIFPNANKRRIGYFERFFSTSATILGGWFFVLVPVAFLPRLVFQEKAEKRESLVMNLVAGLAISLSIGLVVRFLW